jgi:hypothetical protein
MKDDVTHQKIIDELKSFGVSPSVRDPLVQQLIPFPIAGNSTDKLILKRDQSSFSVEESKTCDGLFKKDYMSTDDEFIEQDDIINSQNLNCKLTKSISKKEKPKKNKMNKKLKGD